jgi:hypothetical protein
LHRACASNAIDKASAQLCLLIRYLFRSHTPIITPMQDCSKQTDRRQGD